MTLLLAHTADDGARNTWVIEPVIEWLQAHGLDATRIHRIEIHDIDTRLIRVFEYLFDADGRLLCGRDHEHRAIWPHCDSARRDPYDVLLRVDPPAELLALHTHTEEAA